MTRRTYRHVIVADAVFGRWTVKGEGPLTPAGRRRFFCRCSCGRERLVGLQALLNGNSTSCGCYNRHNPKRIQHGDTVGRRIAPEFMIWASMVGRCTNPRAGMWVRYGGRGIKVCARWADYAAFLEDMGRRPSPKHSIDRIDNDGNYEPSNCRWATPKEQARNTARNFIVEADGERLPLVVHLERRGLTTPKDYRRVYYRLVKLGWPPTVALGRLP
jgi:hypothetical protein